MTRFLRAAHFRNRYIHSQSGLSSFLLMQYKLENAMHFLAVGLSPYQNRICQFRLQAVELTSLDFGTAQC